MVCDSVYFGVGSQSQVDQVDTQASWIVKPMWPNPFREEAFLGIHLADPAPVSFTVYNVCGSVVHTDQVPLVPAGQYQIGWDGRDESGSLVAEGVYFYRVETPGRREAAGKVVVLR